MLLSQEIYVFSVHKCLFTVSRHFSFQGLLEDNAMFMWTLLQYYQQCVDYSIINSVL